jgi:recombination protein RecA
MYNQGISKEGDLIDLATEMGIIEKRGSFYSYGDLRLAQGRENAKEVLAKNTELFNEIEKAVRQKSQEVPLPSIKSVDEDDFAEAGADLL